MDISMEDLSVMGKQSFEMIFRVGQFYSPKIAVCRSREGKIEIAQYEGTFEGLNVVLQALAQMGPIEWMSHTADAYTIVLEDENDPLVDDIDRGITSPSALFEAGDPRAIEALQIVKISHNGKSEAMSLPYRRLPDRIEWVNVEALVSPDAAGRVVRVMRSAVEASHTFGK